MMSEQSTYQKLRGHLAYLRLTAAAEALPAELDHAAKENLGHTAFLERLLDVEVAATETRRHAGLERFASLPASWNLPSHRVTTATPSSDCPFSPTPCEVTVADVASHHQGQTCSHRARRATRPATRHRLTARSRIGAPPHRTRADNPDRKLAYLTAPERSPARPAPTR
jgi:hypothetical protein